MSKSFVAAPPGFFAETNRELTGDPCGEARLAALEACYSAVPYWDSPGDKIASVVASLLKGHFFVDGNKRTALFAYLLLSRLNDLEFVEDQDDVVRIMVDSAAADWDIQKLKNLLFPSA